MDNPYQSPDGTGAVQPKSFDPSRVPPRPRGRTLDRIRLVAWLMAVQGGLEIVMGILLVLIGALGAWALTDMQRRGGPEVANPEFMRWYTIGIYTVFALMHMVPGVLLIWAAIRNYRFRGRTFGIVAMACGMATMFFCVCAPTAIGLAIYGMVVYFSDDATEVFRLGEQGYDLDAIRARFG